MGNEGDSSRKEEMEYFYVASIRFPEAAHQTEIIQVDFEFELCPFTIQLKLDRGVGDLFFLPRH